MLVLLGEPTRDLLAQDVIELLLPDRNRDPRSCHTEEDLGTDRRLSAAAGHPDQDLAPAPGPTVGVNYSFFFL